MDAGLELISDGDGVAVIGDPAAVSRFVELHGLPSRSFELPRARTAMATGGVLAQSGGVIAAGSGRWVKLTAESAAKLKAGTPMKGPTADSFRGVLTDSSGRASHVLQFVKTPGSMLTNPAILAGVGGILAQLAMQQAMDEITDYLKVIDAKVDDVLRAQKDAALAAMIGAGLLIDEAMHIREHSGRVNEVTWSKVQIVPGTIAEAQAYALRQLDAIADKLERETNMGELAKIAKDSQTTVHEWLAVLARCFQLQDAIAVLELDRVVDAFPADLDSHRIGLRSAREARRDVICSTTERLLARMDAAATTANAKVLLHPAASGSIVRSTNDVASTVIQFHDLLGIAEDREATQARRWTSAAGDAKDKAVATGTDGVEIAKRRSRETFGRAKSLTGRLSSEAADRASRMRRWSDDGE